MAKKATQAVKDIEVAPQVIETKEVHISDPVKLIQGGTAFIGQAPIFLENGTLWGIISAPFDTNLLFKYPLQRVVTFTSWVRASRPRRH